MAEIVGVALMMTSVALALFASPQNVRAANTTGAIARMEKFRFLRVLSSQCPDDSNAIDVACFLS
jgi:hypothetical protein